MSHVGTARDWAICNCGWQSEGTWALDEAATHQDEHPDHGMLVSGALYPIATGDPDCPACQAIAHLQRWANWNAEGRLLWPDENEDEEPPGYEAYWQRRPTADGPLSGWLGNVEAFDHDPGNAIGQLAARIYCRAHTTEVVVPEPSQPPTLTRAAVEEALARATAPVSDSADGWETTAAVLALEVLRLRDGEATI